MITVIGKAELPEGSWDAARPAMEAMVKATLEEPGCIDYAFCKDAVHPNTLRIVEHWESRQALIAHFQTPHMAEFQKAIVAIGPRDLEVKLYDADPEPLPGM